jgi:hypothetical protein
MFGAAIAVAPLAFGFRVVLAVTAAAGEANKPTARTMPAATVSTGQRLRQCEDPATTPPYRPAWLRIREKACVFM